MALCSSEQTTAAMDTHEASAIRRANNAAMTGVFNGIISWDRSGGKKPFNNKHLATAQLLLIAYITLSYNTLPQQACKPSYKAWRGWSQRCYWEPDRLLKSLSSLTYSQWERLCAGRKGLRVVKQQKEREWEGLPRESTHAYTYTNAHTQMAP